LTDIRTAADKPLQSVDLAERVPHRTQPMFGGPLCADTVEKGENCATPKISQMLIFGQLRRWNAS
jgi:hypothetical protein